MAEFQLKAVTATWIPGFPVLLESSSFQREMEDTAPEDGGEMEQEESEEDRMGAIYHPWLKNELMMIGNSQLSFGNHTSEGLGIGNSGCNTLQP